MVWKIEEVTLQHVLGALSVRWAEHTGRVEVLRPVDREQISDRPSQSTRTRACLIDGGPEIRLDLGVSDENVARSQLRNS
jgi:hypothetical protein